MSGYKYWCPVHFWFNWGSLYGNAESRETGVKLILLFMYYFCQEGFQPEVPLEQISNSFQEN